MKKLLLSAVICLVAAQLFSQGCTVDATIPKDTIVCGQSILLTAFGQGQGVAVLSENFNNGSFGPGWSATTQAMWNNPCSPNGADGTTHVWLGNSSPVPRALTTASFNLSSCANAGVTICFDMLLATQGNAAPCEGPDEPDEGIYLQYSNDNGTTWTTIHYFDPNGGNDPQFINWNNWCFPVPLSALTANTRFRWFQDNDSGADYDHWGIDNVIIYCNDPTYNIVWQHDNYNLGPNGGTDPNAVAPHATTTYVVVMSNGTNSCRDSVTVFVKQPNLIVDAGVDTSICNGTCAQLNGSAHVVLSPHKTPTYANNEVTPIVTALGQVTNIGINVTGLNMDNVLPNSITSVCITNLNFFGVVIPTGPMGVSALSVTLTCPSGQTIILVPSGITSDSNYTNTCFVPVGGANIATGTPPYTGNYAPNQPFNNLVGCTSNGVWTLNVQPTGTVFVGFGSFTGWSITFDDPEISSAANFNWTPTTNMTGSTTLTPTVCPTSSPTTYTIHVSDTAGCVSTTDSVRVSTHACCNFSIGATAVAPGCTANNGSININMTPSGGNYTFVWADGPITQNRTGLAAGTYVVTVTDVTNSCSKDTTIILNNNSTLNIAIGNVVNPTCLGNNGSALVTLSGGTAPYTVTLDTGGTPVMLTVPIAGAQTVPGLNAKTITISVVDAGGCVDTATATLTAPANCCTFTFDNTVVKPGCAQSNGSITLNVANGSGNYSYLWGNGLGTTSSISGLGVGSYSVTITDNAYANCVKDTTFILTNNSTLSVIVGNVVNPTCAGHNGSATVTLSGGTAPYTVTIDTGTTPFTVTIPVAGTQTIPNLDAVTVDINVVDAGGCVATGTATLVPPSNCCTFTFNNTAVLPGCGLSNGSITLNIANGSGNYSYVWGNNLGTASSVTGLAQGTYRVTITDNAYVNCVKDTTFVLNSNSTLSVSLTNPVNPGCGSAQNGQITVNISGGTAPYTVTIDTGGTPFTLTLQTAGAQTLTNLHAGVISVSATDGNNCTSNASISLTQTGGLNVSLNYSSLICFGTSTGTAAAVVTGGSTPYGYTWSDQAVSHTPSVSGLPWGYISVTVTDAGGCSGSASAIVNQTVQLWYTSILNLHLCSDTAYGDLSIQPTGGIGDLTFYVPTIDTQSTGEFPHILPGTYTFAIKDSLGCVATGNFFIPQSAANDSFTVTTVPTSCFGELVNDGSITVTPFATVNGPYQYSLNGGPLQADSIFDNLTAGTYQIDVKNNYGCYKSLTATITSPAPKAVNALPDSVVIAPGETADVISVTASGFTNPVYSWTPATGLSCISCEKPTITAGDSNMVYYVTVSETQGTNCAGFDSIVVILTGGVKVPNAFTPNGDGHNDLFAPIKSPMATIKSFRIYNRWGAMVHNAPTGWDGTFNGKPQAPGTFVYYVIVSSPDKDNPGAFKDEPFSGSVTLLR